MSDLGSHWNDLPFWALKLDSPLTIEASGPPPHAELAPASMKAVYEYGARGPLPPCRVTWHQGTEQPQILKEGKIPGCRMQPSRLRATEIKPVDCQTSMKTSRPKTPQR